MEQHEIEGTECPRCGFGNLFFVRHMNIYDVASGDAIPLVGIYQCDFCDKEFVVYKSEPNDGVKELAKTMVERGHR